MRRELEAEPYAHRQWRLMHFPVFHRSLCMHQICYLSIIGNASLSNFLFLTSKIVALAGTATPTDFRFNCDKLLAGRGILDSKEFSMAFVDFTLCCARDSCLVPGCVVRAATVAEVGSSRNGVVQPGKRHVAKQLCMAVPGSRKSKRGIVLARIRRGKKSGETEYPWPEKLKWTMSWKALWRISPAYLSRFTPLPTKPKLVSLPFELPLIDLAKEITEVRALAENTGMDFTLQLVELEEKYDQIRRDLYSHLTPVHRLSVARHPNRPTCLDHILNITDKWVELHGDRAGYDDPSLVCGIGKIEDMSFVFIGQQKGRNTKENIYRNFAMPTPHGYRKALRFMNYANCHGFPILTFVDTPGAHAGLKAEELGQGEAIAHNLREMFGLRVPIITAVIGEGGSGRALAIGCCDKMLMLENSVYYVARLQKLLLYYSMRNGSYDNCDAPGIRAAEALRITGVELQKLDVVDKVIPEPIGGAHTDPEQTSKNIKGAILRYMRELLLLDPETLMGQRVAKFRKLGSVDESGEVDPHIKRNMKKSDVYVECD